MSNEFSTNMDMGWESAKTVFGETCTINGTTYDCIIHALEYTDGVQAGRPGRSAAAGGTVVVSKADWLASAGRKGTQITFPFGTYRIINDPKAGSESLAVILNIGPLT